MTDANDTKPDTSSPAGKAGLEQTEGDVPNLGPTPDPSGRDFGDSAGYGSGGSTRDYQEVVGENPVTEGRPNPLDAVIPTGGNGDQDGERRSPDEESD